jgi:hypothetical protein
VWSNRLLYDLYFSHLLIDNGSTTGFQISKKNIGNKLPTGTRPSTYTLLHLALYILQHWHCLCRCLHPFPAGLGFRRCVRSFDAEAGCSC